MAKPKSKQSITSIIEGIDFDKPLVRDFVDKNTIVLNFLSTRLPHVPHAYPKFNLVYVSKDKKTAKYRVNWYREEIEGVARMLKIVHSQYIQVMSMNDNSLEMLDLTNLKPI